MALFRDLEDAVRMTKYVMPGGIIFTEEQRQAVAKHAFEHNMCIFHAAHEVLGSICNCVNCKKPVLA